MDDPKRNEGAALTRPRSSAEADELIEVCAAKEPRRATRRRSILGFRWSPWFINRAVVNKGIVAPRSRRDNLSTMGAHTTRILDSDMGVCSYATSLVLSSIESHLWQSF